MFHDPCDIVIVNMYDRFWEIHSITGEYVESGRGGFYRSEGRLAAVRCVRDATVVQLLGFGAVVHMGAAPSLPA